MKKKAPEKSVKQLVERLSSIRDEKDLSFDGVAMLAGLNKSTIYMTEKQKSIPTILTCLRICRAFDVKLSDLLKEIGE